MRGLKVLGIYQEYIAKPPAASPTNTP